VTLGITSARSQEAVASSNTDRLKATVELVYQCKLVADESFIRRATPPEQAIASCGSVAPPFSIARGGDQLQCDGAADRLGVTAEKSNAFDGRCRRIRQASTRPGEEFRGPSFKVYTNAYATLQEALTEDPQGPARSRIDLLAKDIEFRTELLAIGEDFWGGSITSVPSIPPIHLSAMTSLLAQLEALAKEVRDIEGRLDDKALKGLELSAQAAGADGEIRASLPSADRIDVLRRQAEQRVATSMAQVGLLHARQKQIEGEQARLSAQIDALSAQINNALLTAVGNSLGVPPEIQKIAGGGSVEEAFKSYVGAEAGKLLADPDLLSAFGGVGQSAALYVQRVQEVKREVESYVAKVEEVGDTIAKNREYIEDFKAVIRQPTAENLTRIGVKVFEKLAPAQGTELRRGFCRIVDQQKPIAALLEQAREPGVLSDKIRGGVVEGLRRLPGFEGKVREYLRHVIAEVSPGRRVSWIADLVRRGGEVSLPADQADRVKTELARSIATLWPRSLIAKMPEQHRRVLLEELRRRFGIGSQEELVDRIEELAVPRLTVRLNRVAITVGDNAYPVAEWREISDALKHLQAFDIEASKLQARLEAALENLVNLEALRNTIGKEILRQIPFGTLESEVEKLKAKAEEAKRVWDRALADMGEKIGADCEDKEGLALNTTGLGKLAAMQAGARTAVEIGEARMAAVRHEKEMPAPPDRTPPTQFSPGSGIDGAQGNDGAVEREIAFRALDAAVPGAGAVAGLAIKVFQGMQETRELGRKMRELTEESIRLTQTEIQLLATIDATRVAIAVNRLDGELTEIKRSAALNQYDALTRASQKAGAQNLAGLAQIQRRQSLIFYLAERLRQEYDLLDRSIALWGAQGGTTRDAIRRLVEEDPQNIRLALDSDIHLFQWLDRTEERVRTDIDRVLTHWRQLHRLVLDVCNRAGCLPGRSRLGQVQQTALTDVCTLMTTTDCRRFRDWLAQDPRIERHGAEPFSAQLSFSPDGGHVPSYLLNVRVVDVRLGAYARAAKGTQGPRKALRLNSIQLLHPGVGFIRQAHGFVREAMGPSETTSFDWPEAFDLNALSVRWNAGARSARRHFEGYALVTTWRLVATRSPALASLDRDAEGHEAISPAVGFRSGVFVRFAYSYHLPPPRADTDPIFLGQRGRPNIPDLLKRPVIQIAGRARPDLLRFEIPQSTLQLIGDAKTYAAAQAGWLDQNRPADQKASLDCEQQPEKAKASGFATRVCIAKLDDIEEDAVIREQTAAFMRSCVPETALISRRTPTAQRREIEHVVATRYGRIYGAARQLVRNSLKDDIQPASACGRSFGSTYALCDALRKGELISCS
jgi:hypothetical protein